MAAFSQSLFKYTDIARLIIAVFSDHKASIRVLEKMLLANMAY